MTVQFAMALSRSFLIIEVKRLICQFSLVAAYNILKYRGTCIFINFCFGVVKYSINELTGVVVVFKYAKGTYINRSFP